jgi:hypothetical protein
MTINHMLDRCAECNHILVSDDEVEYPYKGKSYCDEFSLILPQETQPMDVETEAETKYTQIYG